MSGSTVRPLADGARSLILVVHTRTPSLTKWRRRVRPRVRVRSGRRGSGSSTFCLLASTIHEPTISSPHRSVRREGTRETVSEHGLKPARWLCTRPVPCTLRDPASLLRTASNADAEIPSNARIWREALVTEGGRESSRPHPRRRLRTCHAPGRARLPPRWARLVPGSWSGCARRDGPGAL